MPQYHKPCSNPKCEHGWIWNGIIIGYIPCEKCNNKETWFEIKPLARLLM